MKHETPGSSAVGSPSSRFGSRFPCVHTVRTDFPELYRYKLKKKNPKPTWRERHELVIQGSCGSCYDLPSQWECSAGLRSSTSRIYIHLRTTPTQSRGETKIMWWHS